MVLDFILVFLARDLSMSLLRFILLVRIELPAVVWGAMSLAGWVLLAGRLPNDPGACAGGEDWVLVLPFTVGVLLGVATWAEAAVALKASAETKASTNFITKQLGRENVSTRWWCLATIRRATEQR